MAVSTDWNLKEPHTLADTRTDEPTNMWRKSAWHLCHCRSSVSGIATLHKNYHHLIPLGWCLQQPQSTTCRQKKTKKVTHSEDRSTFSVGSAFGELRQHLNCKCEKWKFIAMTKRKCVGDPATLTSRRWRPDSSWKICEGNNSRKLPVKVWVLCRWKSLFVFAVVVAVVVLQYLVDNCWAHISHLIDLLILIYYVSAARWLMQHWKYSANYSLTRIAFQLCSLALVNGKCQ